MTIGELRAAMDGLPDELHVEAWMTGRDLPDELTFFPRGVEVRPGDCLAILVEAALAGGDDYMCRPCGKSGDEATFRNREPGDLASRRCPACGSDDVEDGDGVSPYDEDGLCEG